MRVFFSAGEVSGDVVGARLASGILQLRPGTVMEGIGGSRMESAGVRLFFPTNHLGTVGVTEVARALPSLLAAFAAVRRRVIANPPDVAVLIGNDIFNVVLGRWLRSRGVRTVSCFPPQVWIFGAVASLFSRSFDAILASFPEEQRVYSRHGAATHFTGHYLANALATVTPESREKARQGLGTGPGRLIGLLPGSRVHEIGILGPMILDAAALLLQQDSSLRFVLPLAEERYRPSIERMIAARRLTAVVSVVSDSHEVMRASDLLLATSGTTTLEAALIGVPMVIAYRVSWITIGIVRLCIRLGLIGSERIGLPNLVAGREIVPEIRQEDMCAGQIAATAWNLLQDPAALASMRIALAQVRHRIQTPDAIGSASLLIMEQAAAAVAARRSARPLPSLPGLAGELEGR